MKRKVEMKKKEKFTSLPLFCSIVDIIAWGVVPLYFVYKEDFKFALILMIFFMVSSKIFDNYSDHAMNKFYKSLDDLIREIVKEITRLKERR